MPSTKVQGRNLEYAVRRQLRKLGYTVFRCAGSRPVDLVAIKQGEILLIECKTGVNPHLSNKQSRHILQIAKQIYATPILAVRKKYRGIRWFTITEKGIEEKRKEIKC